MSERPWLGNADPALRLERELLRRLNQQQPPAGSIEHGWAALAAEIPAGAAAAGAGHGTAHAASAAGKAGLGLATKLLVGAALGGAALWTGQALFTSPDTTSPQQAPQLRMAAPAASPKAETRPSLAPLDAPAKVVASAPQSTAAARPASSATTLVEEGRLLAKAHELMQAGQSRQALEVLRSSEARYPRSALYQEREVLSIEALAASGAGAAAKQRAARFLKRFPESPHASSLQRFVE